MNAAMRAFIKADSLESSLSIGCILYCVVIRGFGKIF